MSSRPKFQSRSLLSSTPSKVGSAVETSDRLHNLVLDWQHLPPHIQETISLLADYGSRSSRTNQVSNQMKKRQAILRSDLSELGRFVLRILRHSPEQYGLRMEPGGWVNFEQLLDILRRPFPEISRHQLIQELACLQPDRVSIQADRIRANYGHSTPLFSPEAESTPRQPLFHGTDVPGWKMIECFGLVPAGRKYVHLTTNRDYANNVACFISSKPVVVTIQAAHAPDHGVKFYETGTHVWLATAIPAVCVEICSNH